MLILKIKYFYSNKGSQAFIIPFCAFLMLVVFGIASLVIDIGNARYNLREIQIAADASSMAAMHELKSPYGSAAVNIRQEVLDIANRNGVSANEITLIECGIWNSSQRTFSPQDQFNGLPVCDATSNSIRVSISRQVNTFFGKILNISSITPSTSGVASKVPINQCIRPFVIRDLALSGISDGQTFTLDGSAAGEGNWGKIQYSGGNGASYSMMTDQCSNGYRIGGQAPAQTGSANIGDAFEEILGTSYGTNFLVGITSTVMTGNTTITFTEFATLTLISTNGNNGNGGNGNGQGNGNNQNNGFSATFRLEARGSLPNPDPNYSFITLVK